MTTNLDTQVRDAAAIDASEKKHPQMIGILDDAALDAVNGGTVHDVVVRTALATLFNRAVAGYDSGEVIRSNPCGF
jgi:hypothetical protein